MKAFAIALLLLGATSFWAVDNMHLQVVPTMAALKAKPVSANTPVYMLGKYSMFDGMGGVYGYDSSSVVGEDLLYNNFIKSGVTSVGNWVRLNVKTQSLPGGILVSNGAIKEYYTTNVTSSSGTISINLTTDNISTGPAIFSTIYSNRCEVFTPVSTSLATQSYVSSLSADKKTTTHQFYRQNMTYVSLLALTISLGNVNAPASLTVNCIQIGQ